MHREWEMPRAAHRQAPDMTNRFHLRAAKDAARQVKGAVRAAHGQWAVYRTRSLSSAS